MAVRAEDLPLHQQFPEEATMSDLSNLQLSLKLFLAGAQVLGEDRLGEHVVDYSGGLRFLDHVSLNLGEGELSCELVYGYYSAAPVGDSEIRSESSNTAQQLSPPTDNECS